jgi:hypothetical protein
MMRLRFLLFERHEVRLAVPSGDPTTAQAAFQLCYRAVQIASLLPQELGEKTVCIGTPRVQFKRTSKQTLRAVDVPAHNPQHASEVDVRGDVRWIMLKATRVWLDRRVAVGPSLLVLGKAQPATRAAVIQVRCNRRAERYDRLGPLPLLS